MNVSKVLEHGDHMFIEAVRNASEYEESCLQAIKYFGGAQRLKVFYPDVKRVKKRIKAGKALKRIPLLWWVATATFDGATAGGSLGPATVSVDSELGTKDIPVCLPSASS